MKSMITALLLLLFAFACTQSEVSNDNPSDEAPSHYLFILGIAQDAGYPQAGCSKECCKSFWDGKTEKRHPACLAIVDEEFQQAWMIEATPDFKDQLQILQDQAGFMKGLPDGILLTHAHIGHYTGLMQLGREVMGANKIPVFAMPRMKAFLESNGPWSQLVNLENVSLKPLNADSTIRLNKNFKITPFRVPHRDEFSETVGYRIDGPERSAIFIPDIDKWEKWDRDILSLIREVDYAFLDGTFYENGELPNRNMSEIPHPFVEESMRKFESLPPEEKAKIHFIHFNHTNPLIWNPVKRKEVENEGFWVAEEGKRFGMNGKR
jgi:pyrroloquinoline quinone biosynthesis protein B